MKKILTGLLTVLIMLCLFGCGGHEFEGLYKVTSASLNTITIDTKDSYINAKPEALGESSIYLELGQTDFAYCKGTIREVKTSEKGKKQFVFYVEAMQGNMFLPTIKTINLSYDSKADTVLIDIDENQYHTQYEFSKADSNESVDDIDIAKKWYKIGSSIEFGYYEQDNNLRNGSEPLEWVVLKSEDNKVILLSKYIIDYVEYDSSKNSNWENSYLRGWLNKDFIEEAFSDAEKPFLGMAINDNIPDSDTQDTAFLLSQREASQLTLTQREAVTTQYAYSRSDLPYTWHWMYNDGRGKWMTRSADGKNAIRVIDADGKASSWYVSKPGEVGLRPAICLETK